MSKHICQTSTCFLLIQLIIVPMFTNKDSCSIELFDNRNRLRENKSEQLAKTEKKTSKQNV